MLDHGDEAVDEFWRRLLGGAPPAHPNCNLRFGCEIPSEDAVRSTREIFNEILPISEQHNITNAALRGFASAPFRYDL